ncbi:MAG TPA: hypothetical protein VNL69_07925 [Bacteroidota bacterium]|nr:hypothetical protein [Bacteroidota bacterium]
MRLLRIEHAARRTVIYHPSLADISKRLQCFVGRHEYVVVREYPSVGAKEEMCAHCLKERYLLARPAVHVERPASPA